MRWPSACGSCGTDAMIVPSALASRMRRPLPTQSGRARSMASDVRRGVGFSSFAGRSSCAARLSAIASISHAASETTIAAIVEHLHDRADAACQQECDDEDRHRAAQQRLRGQQPPIGGLRDSLCQAFDGIGTRRRTRRFGARHCQPPFGISPTPVTGRMCRISPNHGHWNRIALICREFPESIIFRTCKQIFFAASAARRPPNTAAKSLVLTIR